MEKCLNEPNPENHGHVWPPARLPWAGAWAEQHRAGLCLHVRLAEKIFGDLLFRKSDLNEGNLLEGVSSVSSLLARLKHL